MIHRSLVLGAALMGLAAPAWADWTYRAPQRAGDPGAAEVTAEGRTLSIGCGTDGIVTMSIAPGAPRRGNDPADVPLGFAIDNNRATRIDVPMTCSATSCYRAEVGRGAAGSDEVGTLATQLVSNIRRGYTLQVFFRDNQLGSYTLDGSAAALGRLSAAAPNCVGL